MQRQLVFKIITIFTLIILLIIPINMVHQLVYERMSLRNEVIQDIAKSSALSQIVTGPILIVPYNRTSYDITEKKYYHNKGSLYFFPQTFNLEGNLNVESRHRSIYQARVYTIKNQLTGSFKIPQDFGIQANLEEYQFNQPYIAIGITDTRGIGNNSTIVFDNTALEIKPGTENSKLGSGIHAKINLTDLQKSGTYHYDILFDLQGTSSLNISPIGRETTVKISSNWPHPSFTGDYLPMTRNITDQGFDATWQTNFFASDAQNKLKQCLSDHYCTKFHSNHFGVSLIDPVDHYSKTDRAIKYGILFIGLTFFGFFIFEVTKKLAIHPIQYSFVGMSLAIFFLLLLSLSEYIGFALAYLCSAIACVCIISFYITSILQNKKQGFIFTSLLSLVYILLYILLNAQDYSLVMGSILVFSILSVAMITTRHLDWYRVVTLPKTSLIKQTEENEESNHE